MDSSPKAKFLFQGDSITDCGRSHDDDRGLGTGYVMMAAKLFFARHPGASASFINRGVNGDKVKDLRKRWHEDSLLLKPDVVTILIGINDVSNVFPWKRTTSDRSFEEDYRYILEQTRGSINARMVLMEPFILNTNGKRFKQREKLISKITTIRTLATKFEAILVPLSTIFLDAEKTKGPTFWSDDGFHPTKEGHDLIAKSWLKAIDGSPSEF